MTTTPSSDPVRSSSLAVAILSSDFDQVLRLVEAGEDVNALG